MTGRMSYWLPPHREFLAETDCYRTGRVQTFHQLPRGEWSCPNELPGLPLHPEFHSVMWWERPGLGGIMDTINTRRREASEREATLSLLNTITRPIAERFLDSGVVTDPMEAVCLVDSSIEGCQPAVEEVVNDVLPISTPIAVTRRPNYLLWGGLGAAVLIGGGALAWYLVKKGQ